jgi:hypothetical protein
MVNEPANKQMTVTTSTTPAPKSKGVPVTRKPRAKAKPAEPGQRGPSHPAPTVGRIVHMYDHTLPEGGHAGQEHGPYAAIVTMVRAPIAAVKAVGKPDDDDYEPPREAIAEQVDLWVMPPAFAAYERGGVPFYSGKEHDKTIGRYWKWPPRANG